MVRGPSFDFEHGAKPIDFISPSSRPTAGGIGEERTVGGGVRSEQSLQVLMQTLGWISKKGRNMDSFKL